MTPINIPFGIGWASLPCGIMRDFNGASQLPVFELNRTQVLKPYARIRPLGVNSSDLSIRSWFLAHAVKKADCANGVTGFALHVRSVGFLLENFDLFDWDPDNLRLNNGMADYYADFSRTSLSGRVAQGMTILFMEKRGYSYVGRFSTFLKSAARQVAAFDLLKDKAAKLSNPRIPDFIFEDSHNLKALAESKGSFSMPGTTPDIKGDLREALQQLEGWDRFLNSQLTKSFAVGTYLRESDDVSPEPSLIACVDPESEQPSEAIRYPTDLIRRCNYAHWLGGMGFLNAGRFLLRNLKDFHPNKRRLPILKLKRHQYAFVVLSVRPMRHRADFDEHFWMDLEELFYFSPYFFNGNFSVEIIGLEIHTLKKISEYLITKKYEPLLKTEPVEEEEFHQSIDEGEFIGSVFSDGTILGELRISAPKFGGIAFEEVSL